MTLTFSISRDTILGFAKNYGGLPWWDAVLFDPMESSSGLLYRCFLESPFTNQGSSFLPSKQLRYTPRQNHAPAVILDTGHKANILAISIIFGKTIAWHMARVAEFCSIGPWDGFQKEIILRLWYRAHFSWHFCAQSST